jgi:hypothetical protein
MGSFKKAERNHIVISSATFKYGKHRHREGTQSLSLEIVQVWREVRTLFMLNSGLGIIFQPSSCGCVYIFQTRKATNLFAYICVNEYYIK